MTQYFDKAPIAGRRSRKAADPAAVKVVEVLIVGAGFAGLGSAIQLRRAGITDIAIVERGSEVGGTWRDNQYPGAACDIPSNLYSFSFAQNPGWSRGYSGSREILEYIKGLARDHDLLPLIRFKHNVEALDFDGGEGVWTVTLSGREPIKARSVVMAQGPLSNAGFPNMRGIETFQGKKIHSARWDHSYDFAGKRVAVIGTGASAVQIIPELVKVADKVKVFQRTPGWVLPRFDFQSPDWAKTLFAKLPVSQTAVREAMYWIHESMALGMIWNTPMTRALELLGNRFREMQVKDAWLRRQLTPDFKIGCKRVLMTNDYYPALQQPNARLVTEPIERVEASGVRTRDGRLHELDALVLATGFDAAEIAPPFPVTGRAGATLADAWHDGPKAYLGSTLPGFPNLFLLVGPNAGLGHNSIVVVIEAQIRYVLDALGQLDRRGARAADLEPAALNAFDREIAARMPRTVWATGCRSWYHTRDGRITTLWPGSTVELRRRTRRFDAQHYRFL